MKSAYLGIGLACKVCTRVLVMKGESFLAESVSFYIKIKSGKLNWYQCLNSCC